MKMTILTLAVLSLIVTTNALILDCTYSVVNVWMVNNLYTCTARVIFVGELQFITDVSTNHMAGRNNSDVKGVQIRSQPLESIPFGLVNFFPNLESIDMSSSTVKTVSKRAFEGLKKIKQLHMNDCKVQVIESDLFTESPTWIAISFNRNLVRHVGYGAFDNLPNLTHIHFTGTTCINEVTTTLAATEIIKFRFIVNCPPTFKMTETKIIRGNQLQGQTEHQIVEHFNPLNGTVLALRADIRILINEVQTLRRRVDMLEGALWRPQYG